jgi:Zn-dependent metalloprotease
MKTRFFLSILFTLLFKVASGQEIKPLLDCPNFNKFTTKGFSEELLYYADSIYPRGLIVFNKNRIQELNDFNKITELLRYERESSFRLERETKSFLDDSRYQYFQQYYKEVLVEGGGYSKNIPTDDPCLSVLALGVNIAYDIKLDITPNITENKLKSLLFESFPTDSEEINSQLVISCNMFNNCDYRLNWRVEYVSNGSKISWIDAKTGEILKTIDGNQKMNAPTEVYGIKNLKDSKEGGKTFLRSPDKSIIAYNMSSLSPCPTSTNAFKDNLIPNTTDTEWKTSVASANVYQTFYVTTEAKQIYKELGIDFKKINVGSGCDEENAFSLKGSTTDNAFIVMGASYGVLDMVAHELGHTYLSKFLNNDKNGNKSLHEGIADMLGTYIESKFQKSTDWEMGDDHNKLKNDIGRDLQDPDSEFDCFTKVKDISEEHDRSIPLGHWFYLITEGDKSNNIPALGILPAIKIVLEALNLIGKDADYPDLREKTIYLAGNKYGRCSNELKAITNAWVKIMCDGKKQEDCKFQINSPDIVCEENNKISMCMDDDNLISGLRWYLPSDWTFNGQKNNSNTIENVECVHVTHFPTYQYYPQYFKIEVYSLKLGKWTTKEIKLIDCDGDDPSCNHVSGKPIKENTDDKTPTTFGIYDITGRLVKSGNIEELTDFRINSTNGMMFCIYYDNQGRYIKTEKITIFNQY